MRELWWMAKGKVSIVSEWIAGALEGEQPMVIPHNDALIEAWAAEMRK